MPGGFGRPFPLGIRKRFMVGGKLTISAAPQGSRGVEKGERRGVAELAKSAHGDDHQAGGAGGGAR